MTRKPVDRRRFVALGGTALLSAGLAPRVARAAASADVIVIGTGLSGLNAALTLQGEGARVHTADGIPTRPEFGASQVGRSHARVIDVCRRLGVGRVAEDRSLMPWHRLHLAGEHTRRADFGMESAMESGERAALEILQRIADT